MEVIRTNTVKFYFSFSYVHEHSQSNAETLDLFDMLLSCLQVPPITFRIFNVSQKALLLTHTAMWGFNNKTFLAVACANRLTKHFQVGYLVCTCYCIRLR
ncbi:hypothetical protein NERG_01968 [Nematocida ausubeli]|uniref:Uncharacterized protein n=1 Tax=Nematocida ausubeli (strain ATCC PRA-371 / ERTm2) TaxID=1913371 RepID=H8ZEE7_NEMA1|nr:hypothetical protein NERG_01968 [Nematocida ausubeli]